MDEQAIRTIKEWEDQGILELILDGIVVVSEIEENLSILKGTLSF